MHTRGRSALSAYLVALIGLGLSASASAQTDSGPGASAEIAPGPLLERYCVTCHNERMRTAGLVLDPDAVEHPGDDAATWEKVVSKLRGGAMPPPGRPRPDESTLGQLVSWLENGLDRDAARRPNPGRTVDHRLNRVEYGNAIRDLLALEIDPASLLPADESDHGFDNIADVLSMSPTLLQRYLFAARTISRLAVGDPAMGPSVETFNLSRGLRQDDRMSEALPYGTRGGTVIRHYFPLDGEYVVRIRLGRNFTNSQIRAIATREEIDVLLDGAPVHRFAIGGRCADADAATVDPECVGSGIYRTSSYMLTADEALAVRIPVTAGPHELGVAFVKKSVLTEGPPPTLLPPRHTSSTYQAPRMDIDSVRLEGPFDATGPGDTASRRRIFVCRPTGTEDTGEACATTILSALARRAYRRPVTELDVAPLLRFYREGRAREAGSFERGIQEAITRLLVSPQFLFRIERDAGRSPAAVQPVSDIDLASRLSFFLWSSIPDDELLDVAEQGRLSDPAVIDVQVRRMLADPRATAVIRNFGSQWLFTRNLRAVDPDASTFPDFDDNLREAFERETELFLENQMREDRPLGELLTARHTFVNERLARFYGIPNVYGAHFRRVAVPDANRAGLLGHGSVLTVTSYATRTSPVVRGKYLLENILGAPPPPPPPNVPPLEASDAPGRPLATMRERMAAHRQNAVCASCHARMDALGFALENFDAIGRWRTRDGASVIDASGALPDGTRFSGPAEFREALLTRRVDFVRTFTEKLLTYALGRPIQPHDMPAVRAILREAEPTDYRWSALVSGIVRSEPFRMRTSTSSEPTAVAQP